MSQQAKQSVKKDDHKTTAPDVEKMPASQAESLPFLSEAGYLTGEAFWLSNPAMQGSQRLDAAAAIGRSQGNLYLQRQLSGSKPADIQREADIPPPPQLTLAPNAIKIPMKVPIPMDESLDPVPLTFKQVVVGVDTTIQAKTPKPKEGGKEGESAPLGAEWKAGTTVSPEGPELSPNAGVEVEAEWKKRTTGLFSGFTPKAKTGVEGGKDGVGFNIEGSLEGDNLSGSLKLTPYELKEGEKKLMNLAYKVSYKPTPWDVKLSDGSIVTVTPVGYVELQFEPDWKKLLKYLYDALGEETVDALAESAVTIGVPIAAGVAAAGFIAGTMYLAVDAMEKGHEAGNAASMAGAKARNYAWGFAAGATGKEPGEIWPHEVGPGSEEGKRDAQAQIQAQIMRAGSLPSDQLDALRRQIIEANKAKGTEQLAQDAYIAEAKVIYKEGTAAYRERHKEEVTAKVGAFFGVQDLGTGLGSFQDMMAITLEGKQPIPGPFNVRE